METRTFWVSILKSYKHAKKPLNMLSNLILAIHFHKNMYNQTWIPQIPEQGHRDIETDHSGPPPSSLLPLSLSLAVSHPVKDITCMVCGNPSPHAWAPSTPPPNSYPWRTLCSRGEATPRQAERRGLARCWSWVQGHLGRRSQESKACSRKRDTGSREVHPLRSINTSPCEDRHGQSRAFQSRSPYNRTLKIKDSKVYISKKWAAESDLFCSHSARLMLLTTLTTLLMS